MLEKIALKDAAARNLALSGSELSYCGMQLVLVFEEGFYCGLALDDRSESIELREAQFDLLDFGEEFLIELGVCSDEDIRLLVEAHTAAANKRIQAKERVQYERLKAKFDPESIKEVGQ